MLYKFVRAVVLLDVTVTSVDEHEKRLLLKQSMRRGLQMTLGAEVSDNDTAPRNGVDEILDQTCDETGHES